MSSMSRLCMSMKDALGLKPRIGVEEYCKRWYDSRVFCRLEQGTGKPPLWERLYNSMVNKHSNLRLIDRELFRRELTALQVALLDLAIIDHLMDKEPVLDSEDITEYAASMIRFTKDYLQQSGQIDIWNAMVSYANSLAQLAHAKSKAPGNEWTKAHREAEDMYTQCFTDQGLDDESALYSARQMLAASAFTEEKVQDLADELARRLQLETQISADLLSALAATIELLLYSPARHDVESVRLERSSVTDQLGFYTNQVSCIVTSLLGVVVLPIQMVSTFILGILVQLTFGVLLIPFDVVWMVLFLGPLVGLSWLWRNVIPLRVPIAIVGTPIAILGFIYVCVLPSMGDFETRYAKILLCETWPFTSECWSFEVGKVRSAGQTFDNLYRVLDTIRRTNPALEGYIKLLEARSQQKDGQWQL